MEWTDDGIVLGARKHGETSTIATLFTRERGRHMGIVHGGVGRRARGVYQSGNLLNVRWRARLNEQLGSWSSEINRSFVGDVLDDALRLAALTSACAITDAAFPERQSHLRAYLGFVDFLESLSGPAWPCAYVHWELLLLAELGYGLDLSACAATGVTTDLRYVSPNSGRAVSAAAGAPYVARLLPLPAFLIAAVPWDDEAIRAGLSLTGHFLSRHVFAAHHAAEPAARSRFLACLVEMTTGSGVKSVNVENSRHS